MHRILTIKDGVFRFLSQASTKRTFNDRIVSRIYTVNGVAYRIALINKSKTVIFYQVDDIDSSLYRSTTELNIFCSAHIEDNEDIRFFFNHMNYKEFGSPKNWDKYNLEQFRAQVLEPIMTNIAGVTWQKVHWDSNIKSFVCPNLVNTFKDSVNNVNINKTFFRLEILPKIKNYKFKKSLKLLPEKQHLLDRDVVLKTAYILRNIYSNGAVELLKQIHCDLYKTVHSDKKLPHETFLKFMVIVSLFSYPLAPKSKYSNVLLTNHNLIHSGSRVLTVIGQTMDTCLSHLQRIDLGLLNKTLHYFNNLNLEPAYGETDGEAFEQEYNNGDGFNPTLSTNRRLNRIGYTKGKNHKYLKSNK